MKLKLMRFMMVNIGILIMAIGLYFFLIPANLAVGGVTGLAMVIQSIFQSINLGLMMGGFNLILFILAFMIIGKEFGGYTIYCSFLLSVVIGILEMVIPMKEPLVTDLLINLIFGILIQGVGMAVIFYQNASTGGTDIVAKIINKYTHLSLGKALFLSDALITFMAGATFGITLGLYAFLGILINGLVIDKVISGLDERIQTLIISEVQEDITKFIMMNLERGFTYLDGLGGYTLSDKKIICVILSRHEYMRLKHYVKEKDSKAFMVMNTVHEVIGEGFNNSN